MAKPQQSGSQQVRLAKYGYDACVPIRFSVAVLEGAKSFVDDLVFGQGVVPSRAAHYAAIY